MSENILMMTSVGSKEEAEKIAHTLVDKRLAACVNIFPGMTAIYIWEGKRERGSEAAMIIKTRASLASRVIAEARKLISGAVVDAVESFCKARRPRTPIDAASRAGELPRHATAPQP